MKGNILIIEDEKKLSDIMKLYLEKDGFNVTCAYDGFSGEAELLNKDFNLIILDIMMPNKDGWSLLRKIKSEKKHIPVIITTARGEEEDRIFGLELGADDYMVKPLSMRELILRVNLRIKSTTKVKDHYYEFGNLFINEKNREVKELNTYINLTPKEFDLLLFLSKNPNQVFNREQLLTNVWGYDFLGDTRTVDTHIKNLREKIKFCNENIKTIWGIGYKLSYNRKV